MSGGDIAAIIAACGFVLLVLFIAVPLFKLGAVLDESRISLRQASQDLTPLISELTETVQEANKQLAKVDVITTNVAEVTSNVSAVVALAASTVGAPLVKIAGIASSLRSVVLGKKK